MMDTGKNTKNTKYTSSRSLSINEDLLRGGFREDNDNIIGLCVGLLNYAIADDMEINSAVISKYYRNQLN